MLQFCRIVLNNSKPNVSRLQLHPNLNKLSSSATTVVEAKSSTTSSRNPNEDASDNPNLGLNRLSEKPRKSPSGFFGSSATSMVDAAFASLNDKSDGSEIKTPYIDDRISKARNVEELLSLSGGIGVSRKFALKVVSVLSEWSSTGKIKIADFEQDPRFIRLCRVLTKNGAPTSRKPIEPMSVANRSEDLSTILSVTADDEAAKLVGSITLGQMVKVMSTLSQRKRRSTLLLRALAYNITASNEQLDIKQGADLLYSMSTLNFPDESLIQKIGNDVCATLQKNVKSAVIGSIYTSLGMLRYKHPALLDELCEWTLENNNVCRPQDIFSMFMTLAVLNYIPSNSDKLFEVLVPQLTQTEAGKPQVWLDIVWSLVLLDQASESHISSVLNESFIGSLQENTETQTSTKLKLLNINGAAENLAKSYKGPTLGADSEIRRTKIGMTREKLDMVDALIDTLKTLIHSENCIRTKINSGMGFFIDATCLLDKKCSPLPLNKNVSGNVDATKIAVLAHDYHDMCRGRVTPTGINNFARRLLEAQQYKVLIVPYTDFKWRDKIVRRVQFLEPQIKAIVKSS